MFPLLLPACPTPGGIRRRRAGRGRRRLAVAAAAAAAADFLSLLLFVSPFRTTGERSHQSFEARFALLLLFLFLLRCFLPRGWCWSGRCSRLRDALQRNSGYRSSRDARSRHRGAPRCGSGHLLPVRAAGDLAPHLSGSRRSSLASGCGLSRRSSRSRDAAACRRRAGVVFTVRLLRLVGRWGMAVMNDASAPTRDRIIHCRVLRTHFRRL